MFLTGRNQMILDHSLVDTMRMFQKMGYGGIELSIVRGLTSVLALDYLDDYVIREVNEVSEELNFPVTALACHQNYVTDELTFQAQKRLLASARKYHTDIVIMSTFIPYEIRENTPEVYDKLVERTGELCKAAEYQGVKLAIEVEPNQLFHNLKSFLMWRRK